MAQSDKNLVSLVAAEHIGPTETGDNIDAKKVAVYIWDGISSWARMTQPGAASAPSALLSFLTAVPTAGTRVQLASNTVTNGFILEAPSTNTGLIYIGGSAVSSSAYGAELQPGQSTSVVIDNTNKIYIDASVSGDNVACLGS